MGILDAGPYPRSSASICACPLVSVCCRLPGILPSDVCSLTCACLPAWHRQTSDLRSVVQCRTRGPSKPGCAEIQPLDSAGLTFSSAGSRILPMVASSPVPGPESEAECGGRFDDSRRRGGEGADWKPRPLNHGASWRRADCGTAAVRERIASAGSAIREEEERTSQQVKEVR